MAETGATTNMAIVNAKLARMERAVRGRILETAVRAGLLPVETYAKIIVHKLTGNLASSIHTETTSDGTEAEGRSGTNVEYALAEEFRVGGGHAYMRPAYDAEKETAVSETTTVLRQMVRGSAE